MMELLNWIAQDTKHFIGSIVFMVMLSWCLVWIISAIRGEPGPAL